jgi:sodium/potassium-transporting ATPase subunit beta-1-interacting protein
MGLCSKRRFLQIICVLQIVIWNLFSHSGGALIESVFSPQVLTALRQVFDFLGFMWVPILTNFFNVVFCIFGYFGVHEYRYKYVLTVTIFVLG